jgi:predicted acyltransferase
MLSLDMFRGETSAGMMLLNHLGSDSHIDATLRHVAWNGRSFADSFFPFLETMAGGLDNYLLFFVLDTY